MSKSNWFCGMLNIMGPNGTCVPSNTYNTPITLKSESELINEINTTQVTKIDNFDTSNTSATFSTDFIEDPTILIENEDFDIKSAIIGFILGVLTLAFLLSLVYCILRKRRLTTSQMLCI